jgi:hypothetical protein
MGKRRKPEAAAHPAERFEYAASDDATHAPTIGVGTTRTVQSVLRSANVALAIAEGSAAFFTGH